MRITRRTSGGRGEYEISEESPEGLSPRDLLERKVVLQLDPNWSIETGVSLKMQGGKFRLRRDTTGGIQLPRQLIATLMMPEAVRADVGLGMGAPVMQSGRYAVEHIIVAGATLTAPDVARLGIDSVELRNASLGAEEINVSDRIASIRSLWSREDELPAPLPELLRAHRRSVLGPGPVSVTAEKLVRRLQFELFRLSADLGIVYSQQTDVLEGLLAALAITVRQPVLRVEEVDPTELDVRRRTTKAWKRWANARGPKTAIFRQQVRDAYRSTCLFCGLRLPPTAENTAGVDAAHILPWADYDLDDVRNGVCLCKLHHWAFDEGLLTLSYSEGAYVVMVPEDIRATLEVAGDFSLELLESVVGQVPATRLPIQSSKWPAPELLDILNAAQGL